MQLAIPLAFGLGAELIWPGVTLLGGSMFAWGWSAGSILYSLFSGTPGGGTYEGQKLTDLGPMAVNYGAKICSVYGTTKAEQPSVMWASDLIPTTTYTTTGGKGGAPEITTSQTTYSQHIQVLVCKGPVAGIRKIWANGKLIMDASSSNTGVTGKTGNIRIYAGTEDQMPDSLIESYVGIGNEPAHRGYCYVMFENFQLGDYGNHTPNFEFEVVSGEPATPTFAPPTMLVNTPVFNAYVDDFSGKLIYIETNHTDIHYFDLVSSTVIKTITLDDYGYWVEPGKLGTFWVWKDYTFDIYDVALGAVIATAPHPGPAVTNTMCWFEHNQEFLMVYFSDLLSYRETSSNVWEYTTHPTNIPMATHYQSIEVTPDGYVILYSDYYSKLVVMNSAYSVVLQYDLVHTAGSYTWERTSTYDTSRNKVYILTSASYFLVLDLNTMTATEIATANAVWPLYHEKTDMIVTTESGWMPLVKLWDPDDLTEPVETFGGDTDYWPYTYMDGRPIELPWSADEVIHLAGGAGIDKFQIVSAARLDDDGVTLAYIVSDLCLRAGLQASDIDVSDLESTIVDGFKVS